MSRKERFLVAQIGRTVGLKGDLKLHLYTDFPQQFRAGVSYATSRGELRILRYDPKRNIVCFEGYDSIEKAKALTNLKLFADAEQTEAMCPLAQGEYYWHDIVGMKVIDGEEMLGEVVEIERMAGVDYLVVLTASRLVASGAVKRFLIPYIKRYVSGVDLQNKTIQTRDTKAILEAS